MDVGDRAKQEARADDYKGIFHVASLFSSTGS